MIILLAILFLTLIKNSNGFDYNLGQDPVKTIDCNT